MFVFWKGWGLLVIAIVIASVFLGDFVVELVTGDATYVDAHRWTIAVKAIPAGIAVWFLGRYLDNRKARIVVDAETGETLVLRQEHSFMHLKMHWWGPIFVLVGIGNVIADLVG